MFPKETTFYDYDLLLEKMSRFIELFPEKTNEKDDFVYIENHRENLRKFANILEKDNIPLAGSDGFAGSARHEVNKEKYATSCIVWKFEKELYGHYSTQELYDMILRKKPIDFFCNFTGNENCTLTINDIPIPFSELPYTFERPFLIPAYQIDDKIFSLEGNISFYAGIITNQETRLKVMYEIPYRWGYLPSKDGIISKYQIRYQGGIYIHNITPEYKEKKLKEEQKEFIKSLTLKT